MQDNNLLDCLSGSDRSHHTCWHFLFIYVCIVKKYSDHQQSQIKIESLHCRAETNHHIHYWLICRLCLCACAHVNTNSVLRLNDVTGRHSLSSSFKCGSLTCNKMYYTILKHSKRCVQSKVHIVWYIMTFEMSLHCQTVAVCSGFGKWNSSVRVGKRSRQASDVTLITLRSWRLF